MTTPADLRVNLARLCARLEALGRVGALEGGGVSRLALTDDDRAGRDLVVGWMRELGLEVSIDRIGNVVALRPGAGGERELPVMIGSHIDTVATGGLYDGNLGVLAGLELVAVLDDAGLETVRPVAVAFFTNEEGARFQPDMMGSAVHQGSLDLDVCLAARAADGAAVGDELARIGYAGQAACGELRAANFFELHVEQGPVLERDGITIGAVTGVQGISWTEWSFTGESNHAGTTPMDLRHDAGLVATETACFVRRLALELGGDQVATVGRLELSPNLINVIPNRVTMTVDLRNTDEAVLRAAEARTAAFIAETAGQEGVEVASRSLARFEPVLFDEGVIARVEREAAELGHSVRRLPAGAGHDAQMFQPNCPTGMVFVPSVGGISHNVEEHTEPADLEAGANVLLRLVLDAAL